MSPQRKPADAVEVTATFFHCAGEWPVTGFLRHGFFTPHRPGERRCRTCGQESRNYLVQDALLPPYPRYGNDGETQD